MNLLKVNLKKKLIKTEKVTKVTFSFKIMTITFILKIDLRDRLKQGQNKETWIHINKIKIFYKIFLYRLKKGEKGDKL